jgi:excisionase family DNA binding protein
MRCIEEMEEKIRLTARKKLDVYTLDELSEQLDMDRQTLRSYIKNGKLKASKIGNKYFVTGDDVMELMQNNRYIPKAK